MEESNNDKNTNFSEEIIQLNPISAAEQPQMRLMTLGRCTEQQDGARYGDFNDHLPANAPLRFKPCWLLPA